LESGLPLYTFEQSPTWLQTSSTESALQQYPMPGVVLLSEMSSSGVQNFEFLNVIQTVVVV
jgi:hypothetical protein